MQYLLMIYDDENFYRTAPKAELERRHGAYVAYTEALKSAGVIRGGERLQPVATSSTVRAKDGKTVVLDGPYVETKEQLAGYYVIEVDNLDKAIEWAARCPAASNGTMEVRPIWLSPMTNK